MIELNCAFSKILLSTYAIGNELFPQIYTNADMHKFQENSQTHFPASVGA